MVLNENQAELFDLLTPLDKNPTFDRVRITCNILKEDHRVLKIVKDSGVFGSIEEYWKEIEEITKHKKGRYEVEKLSSKTPTFTRD